MAIKSEEILATGRRKCAVARVRLQPGTGKIEINGKAMAEYFPSEALCGYVNQVLKVTETEGKVDIRANLDGGGMTGQASIEMKGDTVMLVREGEASMRLILRQGCKYISTYSTPFGRLDMEALPTKVMYVMGEKDGRIELEYHVHMQNQYLGMNRVSVQFHPQA